MFFFARQSRAEGVSIVLGGTEMGRGAGVGGGGGKKLLCQALGGLGWGMG